MAAYITLTTAANPDPVTVLAAVKTSTGDPTAALIPLGDGIWRGKKAAAWMASQVVSAQSILDTTAAVTPQLDAQRKVDNYPIEVRAIVLALIDETNRMRAALRGLGVTGLPNVTAADALAAVRQKAGGL